MADCVQVVDGKKVRAPIRYQAPRKAVVSREVFNKPKRIAAPVEAPKVSALPRIVQPGFDGKTVCGRILVAVARVAKIRVADLVSERRMKNFAHARQVAAYLIYQKTSLSLPRIGRMLGGRDHSTIHHAIKKIEGNLPQYAGMIAEIEAELKHVDNMWNKGEIIPCADENGGKLAA